MSRGLDMSKISSKMNLTGLVFLSFDEVPDTPPHWLHGQKSPTEGTKFLQT